MSRAAPTSWRAITRHDAGAVVAFLAAIFLLSGARVSTATDFLAGADISALAVHESNGATYRDIGQSQAGDAIGILGNHGVNWYRLRLFVDPQAQNNYNGGSDPFVANDLSYTITLAQRVKQAGGNILLDLHYSDTWGDPGHQWKPDAWRSLAMPALQQQVYDYTKQTLESFKAAGVLPGMVQIGNEISNGVLWSGEYVQTANNSTIGGTNTGYPWTGGTNATGFDRLASLLSAGIQGARDGAGPGNEPRIMIHHDKGSDWSTSSYYFDRLLPRLQANGTDIDVIGYSYYPIYHSGGIAAVQQNLNNTAAAYGKPVMIAETGYPFRNPTAAEQNLGFPVTEAGQQLFLESVVDAVKNVPQGMGQGVFWWYAEARPTAGLNVWQNGRFGLFDQSGNLNDAARVFEQFIARLPGDYNEDGSVDAADYVVWRDTDGSPDGYSAWRANFGRVYASSEDSSGIEAPAVPEPATIRLIALGCAGLAVLWNGLRSHRGMQVIIKMAAR
jgi:arabinogalactan endo-1,4-beta-galactosidase